MKQKRNFFYIAAICAFLGVSQAVAVPTPVTPIVALKTDNYCATRNFKDAQKKIHEYRINSGKVQWRLEGDASWADFPKKPKTVGGVELSVQKIAADNNRIFVLASDGNLYWFCVNPDQAQWVSNIFDAEIGAPEPLQELIRSFKQAFDADVNTPAYKYWVQSTHNGYLDANSKWEKIMDLPPPLDPNPTQLERPLRSGLPTGFQITDLAVGNWNGTVVTYYVLGHVGTNYNIYWIDEEPMMKEWKTIESKNTTVRLDQLKAHPGLECAKLLENDADLFSALFGSGWGNSEIEINPVFPTPAVIGSGWNTLMGTFMTTPPGIYCYQVFGWHHNAWPTEWGKNNHYPIKTTPRKILMSLLKYYDANPYGTSPFSIILDLIPAINLSVNGQTVTIDLANLFSPARQTMQMLALSSVIAYKVKYGVTGPSIPLTNSPKDKLTAESRINASNSVIAASVRDNPDKTETHIYYIRYDYHCQPNFTYWPFVDWTEDGWRDVYVGKNMGSFGINSNSSWDPTVSDLSRYDGWWFIPPVDLLGYHLSVDGWEGFLGTYDYKKISTYPVAIAAYNDNQCISAVASNGSGNSTFFPGQSNSTLRVLCDDGASDLPYQNTSGVWYNYYDCPLKLKVEVKDAGFSESNNSKPVIKLTNLSSAKTASNISLRLWFSKEEAYEQTIASELYYANPTGVWTSVWPHPSNGNLICAQYDYPTTFTLPPNTSTADNGFQAGIHFSGFSNKWNKTNDWSWLNVGQNYITTTRIAVYCNGKIVYGSEPSPTTIPSPPAPNGEKIMSFEDASDWSITGGTRSLSNVFSHVAGFPTNAHSVQMSGGGYQVLTCRPMSTAEVRHRGVSNNLAIELSRGFGIPNPFWAGQMQILVSCPSANLNNFYLGARELQNALSDRFNTYNFTVPPDVLTIINQDHPDFTFSIVVNTAVLSGPYLLDLLRFVP